ncbi:MAG: thioredoxin fold domain-containing protein [Deltaproteobacteria bacterium]|jgi:thioredoxin-related protein|nr:thioredoxin fold domain-containing protein [Deltaproteobacteria bacterium]
MNRLSLTLGALTIFAGIGVFLANSLVAEDLALPPGLKRLTYAEALSEAAKDKKLIMLYFWADWCPSCQAFNANTLPNSEVLKTLNASYAVVSINTAEDPDGLGKQFGVRSIPAFIFMDSQGQALTMLPGAVDANIFVLVLNYISSGSYATMEFEEFAKLGVN